MISGWRRLPALSAAAACTQAPDTQATGAPVQVEAGPVEVVAGVPGVAGRGLDGLAATETWLFMPQDVATSPDGRWWVVDFNNHLIREVGVDGLSHIVAGSGFPSGGDGGPALEEPLDHPTGAILDPTDPDVLWFAAAGNHRIGHLQAATIAFPIGNGEAGFSGDGGPAAEASFWRPSSVAFGADGTAFVSDRMNLLIRSVGTDGIVATVAGTPGVSGYTGDGGPADLATLNSAMDTESDPGGRIDVRGDRMVIADTGNHAIRELTLSTGVIETLAGPEHGFVEPHDVALADDGTVYVADTGNHCIRAIATDRSVGVVAGACGESGDAVASVPPTDARFAFPTGVAWSTDGHVWISDRDNHVIRRFAAPR